MKIFTYNLRFAIIMSMAIYANGIAQSSNSLPSNRTETRLLVQALMQDELLNGSETDTSLKTYFLLNSEANLNVPKKIYLNNKIIHVITQKTDVVDENSIVFVLGQMNLDQGFAVVNRYDAKKNGFGVKKSLNFASTAEDSVADLSFEK